MSFNKPKWAQNSLHESSEMGLNEPKLAQVTQNMFRMIPYEFKMGLNERKSTQIILNKPK